MVFKKIIFQNRYVAFETPSGPPPLPFMANTILNFHFDYPHPSLIYNPHYQLSIIHIATCAVEDCEWKELILHLQRSNLLPTWVVIHGLESGG